MEYLDWSFNTKLPLNPSNLLGTPVADHPLRVNKILVTESRIRRRGHSSSTNASTESSTPIRTPSLDPLQSEIQDPLTQFAKEQDPLSQMAQESERNYDDTKSRKRSREHHPEDNIEPWSVRRAQILAKYTTSEKLSIVTSFLSGGEKVVVKAQSATMDKVKMRLEQLDEFEEGSIRHEGDLSQKEYMIRIEQLNSELVLAWKGDQKVRALKIAIQCAKLLADTSVMAFYPSKFVLITDILDIFGTLVYERLRVKADPSSSKVILPDMVLESAKETCRNWFYKIASIRELVPRLYIEMAILKSYSFLTTSEFSAALMRLTRMIRGIGHPLVAIYARCYLCRVGMAISTPHTDRTYLSENFKDFMLSYSQVLSNGVLAELQKQRVEVGPYLSLYPPALDWILQGAIATTHPATLLNQVLDQTQKLQNNGLLLNTIMASFKPDLIAERALSFVEMINSCYSDNSNESFPSYILFRTLGLCLTVQPPAQEDRRQVLNNVWKVVTTLTDAQEYVNCAEVWAQYAVVHFTSREINTLLLDIIKKLTPNRSYEKFYPQLQLILQKIVNFTSDFESLLMKGTFLQFLDMFQKESVRIEACRTVITAFSSQNITVNDPIVINALMFICKVLHDSVNALTVDDERRQIGNLITNFVRRVDYGRDFEQQLNFYVEARASFTNLDAVLAQLVQCVNRLSVDTRKIVKGNHTRKTGAFVRACAAYCYITIPSIVSVTTRMDLYLLSGQVAIFNQCLGQGDSCFKAALALIEDYPKTIEIDGKLLNSEPLLISYIKNFLSVLLVIPDSPDQSVLYLLKSLLSIIQSYNWVNNHGLSKACLYFSTLDVLAIAARETYPYHIDKVDSNDSLYGSDTKFIEEINKLAVFIIEELLSYLKVLGQTDQRLQSIVAVALSLRVILRGDLNKHQIGALAINLWHLGQKFYQFDVKYYKRTLGYLVQRSNTENENYKTVISKLQIINV